MTSLLNTLIARLKSNPVSPSSGLGAEMQGKTVLVTGASDGIGKQTALELARRGARVITHGRSTEKVAQAQDEIRREVPGASLEIALADFASLEQVGALARDIQSRFDRLDVLLHNAGVYMKERRFSVDGFEMTFAVNHLGPFLLTCNLLQFLRASHARVITVSSIVHSRARIDFENLNAEKDFDGYNAYAQSKLANVLFANELAERERGNLSSNSLHPGVITTKLLVSGFNITGASLVQGAATSVYLATSPDVASVSGKYFSDCRECSLEPHVLDRAAQKQLWELSEQMIGGVAC